MAFAALRHRLVTVVTGVGAAACVSVVSADGAACAAADGSTTPSSLAVPEPSTGQMFPVVRRGAADNSQLALSGVTVRCMLGLCRLPVARGYAFALYVDGRALDIAAGAPSAVQAVLAAKRADPSCCEVAVCLKMARNVKGDHMAHGFERSVARRVQQWEADAPASERPSLVAGVAAFARAFRDGDIMLYEGDSVEFVWPRDGAMVVKLNGEPLPVPGGISTPVAHAVLQTYVAKDGVSPTGAADMEDKLVGMAALYRTTGSVAAAARVNVPIGH